MDFSVYGTSDPYVAGTFILGRHSVENSTNGALSEVSPSGRTAPPLVVSLPSGELHLGKDNIGVFVDQNGKHLQEGGRICWSEAPASMVIEMPYAIGLLPRHIELRSLRDPYPLIQTVVLRNARRILQSTHAMIVALETYCLWIFSCSSRCTGAFLFFPACT